MKHAAVLAAVLAAFALPLRGQFTYTLQPTLVTGPTVMTEGCILADVDGDADLDVVFANGFVLFISGSAIQPTLLINKINQGLGLVDETATRLPTLAIKGTQVVACDVEPDGDLDLLFTCNGPSQQRLYVNDGTGVFTDQSVTRLGTLVVSATCAAFGDVERDGDLDLFINDEANAGQLKLFLNNGSGTFTNVTATHLPAAPKSNQQDINVCDLDNDWDLDVINCGKSSGQQIFLNDGTGHYSVTTSLLPLGTGLTYETDVADLDNDGDLDLAMLSTSGLVDSVIRNNFVPSGTLSFTASPGFLTGGNTDDDNEFVYVDANDDGFLDIVIGSLQAGSEKLYLNNGAFSFARQANGFSPLLDSTLDVAVGDLNGDGRLDMVTAQGESGSFINRAYYGATADTRGPQILRLEDIPTSTNPAGPWRTRAMIQDSGVDDSETTVGAITLSWSIAHRSGITTGSAAMRTLGGLLWEGTITAPPGVLMPGATVTWQVTAVDHAGNTTVTPTRSFTVCGFEAYGTGLGGLNTAVLSGTGSTALGQLATIGWTSAPPSTAGLLGLSLDRAVIGLTGGGTLLVNPAQLVVILPIAADASGGGSLSFQIPADPAAIGFRADFQAAFDPPLTLTNGLEAVICP